MNMMLHLFVAITCIWAAMKIFCDEERNTVFNKRPIEVVDVKKYNQLCGYLVIGFGVAAEVTIYGMYHFSGWYSVIFTVLLIAESVLVVVIYNKIECKMLKKR